MTFNIHARNSALVRGGQIFQVVTVALCLFVQIWKCLSHFFLFTYFNNLLPYLLTYLFIYVLALSIYLVSYFIYLLTFFSWVLIFLQYFTYFYICIPMYFMHWCISFPPSFLHVLACLFYLCLFIGTLSICLNFQLIFYFQVYLSIMCEQKMSSNDFKSSPCWIQPVV